MRSFVWLMLLSALASGCGRSHQSGAKPPGNAGGFTQLENRPAASKLIVTPETGLSGKVAKVNAEGRFVVLNFPIGHLPAIDQRLSVYHLGLKVGEVKVSGPQRDDNIVADLVTGTAAAGDEVRE